MPPIARHYGTLDLVVPEWTRDHIAAFGGNPTGVVVFGESAGATNISSLLVSPYAAGLFHGAILQSGGTGSASAARATNYADDAEPGDVLSASEMLLKAIQGDRSDCDRACARAEADALSLADQGALLRDLDALAVFELYSDGMDLLGPNSPTVIRDGAVLPSEPFLDEIGAPGRFNAVPTMVGTNRDEPKIFMAFNPDAVKRFAACRSGPTTSACTTCTVSTARWRGAFRGVDDIARRLAGADVPVWAYRWDWDEEGSFAFIDLTQLLGAAHGLEIPFVFGHFDLGPQTPLLFNDDNAEGRLALSARMMAYWAAFARDLDPGTGADDGGPRWAPWNPAGEQTYVRLDTGPNGIAMASDEIDIAGFAERIAEDGRFENARNAARCSSRPCAGTIARISRPRPTDSDALADAELKRVIARLEARIPPELRRQELHLVAEDSARIDQRQVLGKVRRVRKRLQFHTRIAADGRPCGDCSADTRRPRSPRYLHRPWNSARRDRASDPCPGSDSRSTCRCWRRAGTARDWSGRRAPNRVHDVAVAGNDAVELEDSLGLEKAREAPLTHHWVT